MRVSENLVINMHGLSKSFGDVRALSSLDLKGAEELHLRLPGTQRSWKDDYYSYACKHDGTNNRLCSGCRVFSPIRRLARVKA